MYFKIIFYKCYYAKNLLNSFIILLLLFIFFCCFCCCEPQKCQYGAAAAVNTVSTLPPGFSAFGFTARQRLAFLCSSCSEQLVAQ